jgi:hypothetical protein
LHIKLASGKAANIYKIFKLKCHFSSKYEVYYTVLITRADNAKLLLINRVTREVAKLAEFHPSNRFAPQKVRILPQCLDPGHTDVPHRSSVRGLSTDIVLKATVELTRRNSYIDGHKIEDNISKVEIRTLENRRNIYN